MRANSAVRFPMYDFLSAINGSIYPNHSSFSYISDRPRVAQWLERRLGVWEARVQSQIASHQRRKKDILSLALGINELGIRLGGSE